MDHTQTEENQRTCCYHGIIDWWGEPLIIVGGLCTSVALIYSLILGVSVVPWVAGISLGGFAVAEWRVRKLGVAKKLMDSVKDLREENYVLKQTNQELSLSVDEFKNEIENFESVVGLLGENVEDVEEAKKQLFKLYEQYKLENERYENNNLLTLFGLIDKNQDSKLNSEEIKRMKEYVKIVYGEDFDFDILDKDGDGSVSLKEFFNKFRKAKKEKLADMV